MYAKKRDDEYKKTLLNFICSNYEISEAKIEEAKRGFYGETWKVTDKHNSYFVKIVFSTEQKPYYKNSFEVMNRLIESGIDFIPKIIYSKSNSLYSKFLAGILGVFEWIEGENVETDETNDEKTRMLRQIYQINTENLDIKKETFCAEIIDTFYSLCDRLKKRGNTEDLKVLDIFSEYSDRIEKRINSLKYFSDKCKNDYTNLYITHGDAGGNMIVTPNKQYLIDWDHPMIAPPERDAWFNLAYKNTIEAFNFELHKIDYKLNNNRLAYYCFNSYISYLCEYLSAYFDLNEDFGIRGYFESWIEGTCKYYEKEIRIP